MYRDGGSGGSGGDGNAAVICINESLSGRGACTLSKALHTRGSGGDSEIGGDGDGVVMARSLSTSAPGGRDMEV
ncbi:hypothetical protein Tco_0568463 [Tanacetum coccineum]